MATTRKAPVKKAAAQDPTVQENRTVEKTKPIVPSKPVFEFKDRTYILKNKRTPLVFTLPSKHSQRKPLLYFDKEKGYQRELRYATNQSSPFVDEQVGHATLGRIIIRDGSLTVKKEDVALQKLLSLYHPLKDLIYQELDPVQDSSNDIDWIELEFEAVSIARELNIDEAEAILRTEQGSKVSTLSSSELKRDLLIFAKRQPALFIELANDDTVQLRNVGIRAVENNILHLSGDQRTFYYGDNKRKIMTVPFDEHPYSALAAYFKTDEGMEVFKAISKKLN